MPHLWARRVSRERRKVHKVDPGWDATKCGRRLAGRIESTATRGVELLPTRKLEWSIFWCEVNCRACVHPRA